MTVSIILAMSLPARSSAPVVPSQPSYAPTFSGEHSVAPGFFSGGPKCPPSFILGAPASRRRWQQVQARPPVLPLLGDHVPRSGLPTWGNHLVAGLESHWAGVRGTATFEQPKLQ